MADDSSNQRRDKRPAKHDATVMSCAIAVLLLPLLYFLSTGPLAYSINSGYITSRPFIIAANWYFTPMRWAYEYTALAPLIDWWNAVWGLS